MIDILKNQLTAGMTDEEKLNRTREFLQVLCLKIMYDKGAFGNIAFVGGTALRILFDLRRFSEDLDFSLIEKKGYDFSGLNDE
jgi:predicted nucleotidyltransferase component of viral defense system